MCAVHHCDCGCACVSVFGFTMDSFAEDTKNFTEWLTSSVSYKVSSKVKIEDFRRSNEGRCVIAIEDIPVDETIFEIPRESILNVQTSQLVKDHPTVSDDLMNGLGHWEGLILCLFYEMFVIKKGSKWWAYLKVFPAPTELQSLIYWTDEELQQLQPSLILERIGRDKSLKMFNSLLKYIKDNQTIINISVGSFTWETFVYVASIIMAYSFDVENPEFGEIQDDFNEDEQDSNIQNDNFMKSMIPLADTLNSDTKKCNANLIYDSESLKMCAIKPIKAGEQVYNIYGNHSNAELLRRYGYVEWSGSKFDFGEIPLDTIVEVLHCKYNVEFEFIKQLLEIIGNSEEIEELLEGEDMISSAYDCYIDGQILTEVVILLQIMCVLLQTPGITALDIDMLDKQVVRTTKKCVQLLEGGKLTSECESIWRKCIEMRIKDYPSHANREVAAIASDINTSTLRGLMAQRVLQSEIQSLQKCSNSLKTQYKTIDDVKLLNNILKRKSEEPENMNTKRPKH